MGDRESWNVKREWYRQRIQVLIEALDLSPTEAEETRKYTEKYAEIDRILGEREGLKTSDPDYEEVKASLNALSAELLEMMKADISK